MLADQLRGWSVIRNDAGERAFRTVPRHLFTPSESLERAYAPADAVVSKRDTNDLALSSVSAPNIIAMMLEQAKARRFAKS
jgi:protein-L-isoaspartate(D-aspartate) O-methyltransferase